MCCINRIFSTESVRVVFIYVFPIVGQEFCQIPLVVFWVLQYFVLMSLFFPFRLASMLLDRRSGLLYIYGRASVWDVFGTRRYTCIMSEIDMSVVERLCQFLESEARSCSMDFGCVSPEYVCRMWGGAVSLEEIESGLKEIRIARWLKMSYG